jgi:predicted nucleotidyltransferase
MFGLIKLQARGVPYLWHFHLALTGLGSTGISCGIRPKVRLLDTQGVLILRPHYRSKAGIQLVHQVNQIFRWNFEPRKLTPTTLWMMLLNKPRYLQTYLNGVVELKYIEERREKTRERLNLLQSELGVLENILGDKACVYSTGSFGRLEAGSNSDLDLFIVTKTSKLTDGEVETTVNQLSQLDTILVKAGLIGAVRKLKIPDFDADGRYLACHSVEDFLSSLGGPDDDYKNTLTGRLLLFLEGRPLVGEKVHSEVIDEVIAAYFEDFADRSEEFVPAYLANDILRLWRTFCVNYEFGRKSKRTASKIKNYKLKHSRMLTCYSALI